MNFRLNCLVFFFLCVTNSSLFANPTNKRIALVVGNSAYKVSPLKNPVNDAHAIADQLQKLGFDVIVKYNIDRREFRAAVRQFGNKLQLGGVGLFYYAGHGLQVKGRNYLVPVAADIKKEDEIPDEALEASAILRKMESAGNGLNIVILDACRNNPFARSFRSSSRGLARMDAPSGTLVAYSTAPGSVAADGNGGNSTYTKHLLQAMREPGLPVELVFKKVRIAVENETNGLQTPWEESSLKGNFYFRKMNVAGAIPGMPDVIPQKPNRIPVPKPVDSPARQNRPGVHNKYSLRGMLTTDEYFSFGYGVGFRYNIPMGGSVLEIGADFGSSSYSDTYSQGLALYTEDTDITMYAARTNLLINARNKPIYFLIGGGYAGLKVDWELQSTEFDLPTLLAFGSRDSAQGSSSAWILNAGVGMTWENIMDLRLEIPYMFVIDEVGSSATAIKTLALSVGISF